MESTTVTSTLLSSFKATERRVGSLPLDFEFYVSDILAKQYTKLKNRQPFRIHYLGPRMDSTSAVHQKLSYSTQNPYVHHPQQFGLDELERYRVDPRSICSSQLLAERIRSTQHYKTTLFYRAFQGMNPSLSVEDEILFNSAFELGNLDCVIKIAEQQFDLFLRIDSNTQGHLAWFYFSVSNGNRIGKQKFNLVNVSKAHTLYESGMKPYVFSMREHQASGIAWEQPENAKVTFKQSDLSRYSILQQESVPKFGLHTLSIEYEFVHRYDVAYFAYCVPYTYSTLLRDLQFLPSQYVVSSTLCPSLLGLRIPLLHVTDHHSANNDKKIFLVTGRMHPSETNASHSLNGFLRFICSDAKEAIDLRSLAEFVMIPMVNPDGVILGNTRTSAAGRDLNREYVDPDPLLFPEVSSVLQLARHLQKTQRLFGYLDFHGHSSRKNTFFYGPSYPLSDARYYLCRVFPRLIEQRNSAFRYYACSFTIDSSKKRTARAVMFGELGVPYTFTVESSIGYYYDSKTLKTLPFNRAEWERIGESIGMALSDFLIGLYTKDQRIQARDKRRPIIGSKDLVGENPIQSISESQGVIRISYNQANLFSKALEEVKQQPISKQTQDDNISSDDQNELQDMSEAKISELSSLIKQSNSGNSNNVRISPKKPQTTERSSRNNLERFSTNIGVGGQIESSPNQMKRYRPSQSSQGNRVKNLTLLEFMSSSPRGDDANSPRNEKAFTAHSPQRSVRQKKIISLQNTANKVVNCVTVQQLKSKPPIVTPLNLTVASAFSPLGRLSTSHRITIRSLNKDFNHFQEFKIDLMPMEVTKNVSPKRCSTVREDQRRRAISSASNQRIANKALLTQIQSPSPPSAPSVPASQQPQSVFHSLNELFCDSTKIFVSPLHSSQHSHIRKQTGEDIGTSWKYTSPEPYSHEKEGEIVLLRKLRANRHKKRMFQKRPQDGLKEPVHGNEQVRPGTSNQLVVTSLLRTGINFKREIREKGRQMFERQSQPKNQSYNDQALKVKKFV